MKRRNEELKQLLKQDSIVMGMLGKQAVSNQKYRPLTYVLTAETAEKKVFYTAVPFTEGELLLLPAEANGKVQLSGNLRALEVYIDR